MPIKLYETAGLPELPVTEMFTAVTLSAVTDEDERVIIGARLYAVKLPDEAPVPAAFVTAIVPEALPTADVIVNELSLFTV